LAGFGIKEGLVSKVMCKKEINIRSYVATGNAFVYAKNTYMTFADCCTVGS